ncbi:DgyrCDS5209 [Dimorphilus gyrociliatus]|uniref:DgyrCDS5209 n=1 Tax=Dimorphilus gyrociliatus TaxID=2664684 RepID=A0A7I8VJ42_9ANNE|nr:DgyrCDS5209 [Dimorphilus gyrociliatus]
MSKTKKTLGCEVDNDVSSNFYYGLDKPTLPLKKSVFPLELSRTSFLKPNSASVSCVDALEVELWKWLNNEPKEADLNFLIELIGNDYIHDQEASLDMYTVAAFISDHENRILMTMDEERQETWTIPEDKVEDRETLVQAIKRIVLELTGLKFEPETLISVENKKRLSLKFIFAGKIIGGEIKTKIKDKRVIECSKFFDFKEIHMSVKLKSLDILPIMEIGYKYTVSDMIPRNSLPVLNGYARIYIRAIFIRDDPELKVLFYESCKNKQVCHGLPVVELYASDTCIVVPLLRILLLAFGFVREPKVNGIVSIEHNANAHPKEKNDGLCLTILSEPDPLTIGQIKEPFSWKIIKSEFLRNEIKYRSKTFGSVLFYKS